MNQHVRDWLLVTAVVLLWFMVALLAKIDAKLPARPAGQAEVAR